MHKNKKTLQPKTRGASDSLRYDAVSARLNAGDNSDIKLQAEQIGSGMVDKMMANYEIKAENAGFATEDNKFNSSSL